MNRLPQVLLVGIAIVAIGGLHVVGHYSGTFDFLGEQGEKGTYPVPFVPQPIRSFVSSFVAFFYPAVDGSSPGYSLACYLFAGQWMSGWHLIMLEGYRLGNRGKFIAHTTLFGLVYQVLGLGFLLPLYLALHLATTPAVARGKKGTLFIPINVLIATPIALILGYLVPTLAMSLPISIASTEFKIVAVLFWQAFPLWCNLLSSSISKALTEHRGVRTNDAQLLMCLRVAYAVPVVLSAVAHISAYTIAFATVISPWVIDSWSIEYLAPSLLSFPPTPFSVIEAEHIYAQGMLWFIQWDYITSGFALLVWAATLDTAYWKPSTNAALARRMAALAGLAVFLGPMGASAAVLWYRDEDCCRLIGSAVKKDQAQKRLQQESSEYEVEAIVDERKVGNVSQYRVRWVGWSSEHDTWEPAANLGNARDLISEYRSSLSKTRSLRPRRTPAR
jgi:hypothetical protein